jgi:hypothetical protein
MESACSGLMEPGLYTRPGLMRCQSAVTLYLNSFSYGLQHATLGSKVQADDERSI